MWCLAVSRTTQCSSSGSQAAHLSPQESHPHYSSWAITVDCRSSPQEITLPLSTMLYHILLPESPHTCNSHTHTHTTLLKRLDIWCPGPMHSINRCWLKEGEGGAGVWFSVPFSFGWWAKCNNLTRTQTYIGTVVVSVNPYKQVGIYDKTTMETYRGINFYEEPPHM